MEFKNRFKSFEFRYLVVSNVLPIVLYSFLRFTNYVSESLFLFVVIYFTTQFLTTKFFLLDYLLGKYDNN